MVAWDTRLHFPSKNKFAIINFFKIIEKCQTLRKIRSKFKLKCEYT